MICSEAFESLREKAPVGHRAKIVGHFTQGSASMQRAGFGLLLLGIVLAGPAYADCSADAAAMQSRLARISNSKQHDEARLLVEKAKIDAEHGRDQLCNAALQRASKLMN
jgi:hypothetical protein